MTGYDSAAFHVKIIKRFTCFSAFKIVKQDNATNPCSVSEYSLFGSNYWTVFYKRYSLFNLHCLLIVCPLMKSKVECQKLFNKTLKEKLSICFSNIGRRRDSNPRPSFQHKHRTRVHFCTHNFFSSQKNFYPHWESNPGYVAPMTFEQLLRPEF